MKTIAVAVLGLCLAGPATADSSAPGERSPAAQIAYTVAAVVANVTPLSAFYAPLCLPGYVLCKIGFAGVSLLAAAEQLAFSGGADLEQTRAILYRGFGGDWFITPRHIAREAKPEPLPEPAPPAGDGGGKGGFEPPPI